MIEPMVLTLDDSSREMTPGNLLDRKTNSIRNRLEPSILQRKRTSVSIQISKQFGRSINVVHNNYMGTDSRNFIIAATICLGFATKRKNENAENEKDEAQLFKMIDRNLCVQLARRDNMRYRAYCSAPRSQSLSPIDRERALFREFNRLDDAFNWARQLRKRGAVALTIEGDDGTHMEKREIAAALSS